MVQKRIEEASLNAWPALKQLLYDGWILRFSRGYTKRANSVNSLFGSSIDVNAKIALCEKLYAEKGLRPTFRITPFSSPHDLDQVLESCSYQKIDHTLVLHLDLKNHKAQPATSVELRDESLDDWLDVFCNVTGSSIEGHQTHKEILQAIPARRFLASLSDAGRIVACGLGVLEHHFFGLFDLVTDPQQRNRGYGTKLVVSLLEWARKNGALHAYLQVVSDNAPARHLYMAKLGFEPAYAYWYRVPST